MKQNHAQMHNVFTIETDDPSDQLANKQKKTTGLLVCQFTVMCYPYPCGMKFHFNSMGDSSNRLNFDQGKKNEIQHHS